MQAVRWHWEGCGMSLDRRIRKYIDDMRKVTSAVVPAVIANDLQALVEATGAMEDPQSTVVDDINIAIGDDLDRIVGRMLRGAMSDYAFRQWAQISAQSMVTSQNAEEIVDKMQHYGWSENGVSGDVIGCYLHEEDVLDLLEAAQLGVRVQDYVCIGYLHTAYLESRALAFEVSPVRLGNAQIEVFIKAAPEVKS
jgi:hypothetical protein